MNEINRQIERNAMPYRTWALAAVLMLFGWTASLPGEGDASLPEEEREPQGAEGVEARLVPDDAKQLLVLEVGRHWSGPEAKRLREVSQMHPIVLTWWARDLDEKLGLSADEIERAVVLVPTAGTFGVAVTSREPFDRQKILAALAPDAVEKNVRGQSYFASAQSDLGVYFADRRTLWFGQPAVIESLLKRPARAMGTDELKRLIRGSGKGVLLVAKVDPSDFRPAIEQVGEPVEPFLPLFQAKTWSLRLNADDDLRLTLRAEFAKPEAAAKAQPALQAILARLEEYLQLAESRMPEFLESQAEQFEAAPRLAPEMEAAIQAARKALKEAVVKRMGTGVEAVVTVETDRPATTAVLLLSLMPRAAEE